MIKISVYQTAIYIQWIFSDKVCGSFSYFCKRVKVNILSKFYEKLILVKVFGTTLTGMQDIITSATYYTFNKMKKVEKHQTILTHLTLFKSQVMFKKNIGKWGTTSTYFINKTLLITLILNRSVIFYFDLVTCFKFNFCAHMYSIESNDYCLQENNFTDFTFKKCWRSGIKIHTLQKYMLLTTPWDKNELYEYIVLYCSNVKNFTALFGISAHSGGNIPL